MMRKCAGVQQAHSAVKTTALIPQCIAGNSGEVTLSADKPLHWVRCVHI